MNPAAPRPVMSAKAAINAMYAAEKDRPNPQFVSSAREAVNTASRLAPKNVKSAANLHHGSLQKVQKVPSAPRSIESTRTSASALLKTANSDDSKPVPVVHTSLKLGTAAHPKTEPVILPAGSRMAQVAKPVAGEPQVDDSIVAIHRTAPARKLSAPALESDNLKVKVITSGRPKLVAAPRRVIRDPQMLGGGRRVLPARPGNVAVAAGKLPAEAVPKKQSAAGRPVVAGQSAPAEAHEVRSAVASRSTNIASSGLRSTDITPVRKLVRPRRFRTVPKNYTEADSPTVAVDNSYAMAEPPKLAARRRSADADDLGVVKNFRPTKLPEPLGDAAPIGRLAGQRVASGHGGPAESELTIKAENTSNYSFSRRDKQSAKPAPYASADKSPFLKSVTVEKRPLSDSSAPTPISLPHAAEAKPEKTSRKNTYSKNVEPADLPSRPTVIVPSSRRSKAPLFFLILFTIILGAAVGAAVYLCFFQ